MYQHTLNGKSRHEILQAFSYKRVLLVQSLASISNRLNRVYENSTDYSSAAASSTSRDRRSTVTIPRRRFRHVSATATASTSPSRANRTSSAATNDSRGVKFRVLLYMFLYPGLLVTKQFVDKAIHAHIYVYITYIGEVFGYSPFSNMHMEINYGIILVNQFSFQYSIQFKIVV